MSESSLKISLSPRDLRLLEHILPHQLRFWHEYVDEVLLVLDLHGYNSNKNQSDIQNIHALINALILTFSKIRLIEVDYSAESKKLISDAYFGGKPVPAKTHRYGPYYSYFFGIYHARFDNVLSIDSDILFGGFNPLWVEEAIFLLNNEQDVITCSPLPGPPREDGKLVRQEGQTDKSDLRKIYFDSISTRIFFISKSTFKRTLCPLPIKYATFPLFWRSVLHNRPVYALPEDIISQLMKSKGLKRVDFSGTSKGIWSLHPPFRNEEFYRKLPELIKRIENEDIPPEQRGDYDINDSMIDWTDAKEAIRNSSMKRRFLKFFHLMK